MSGGEPAQISHSPQHNADPNPNHHHQHHHQGGPVSPNTFKAFLIPSPLPTRRTRTQSQSQRAAEGPTFEGTVIEFCRNKGHGFILPDDTKECEIQDRLFVHISDIDGEYVPKAGDRIKYKKCLIPPKNEKYQAVHLRILTSDDHERWDSPAPPSPSK